LLGLNLQFTNRLLHIIIPPVSLEQTKNTITSYAGVKYTGKESRDLQHLMI